MKLFHGSASEVASVVKIGDLFLKHGATNVFDGLFTHLDFDTVEIDDEHGTSYLIVNPKIIAE
ncbi:hypothetical protein [Photorhabdus sp. CRCIA-P01]|uniref:hypothetical protein n=1 Tax=Photorhabdus sp. CRCIA-P01 TaxID=2019570 RepID=UPI000E5A012E|nr:hypothetical protein [Photorhabdus sp. CRCIA-P01]